MVRLGRENIVAAARKVKVFRPGTGTEGRMLALQAFYRTEEGKAELFLRTGIKASGRERTNVVFYPGRDPKKPCKATWFHQVPPAPLEDDEEAS